MRVRSRSWLSFADRRRERQTHGTAGHVPLQAEINRQEPPVEILGVGIIEQQRFQLRYSHCPISPSHRNVRSSVNLARLSLDSITSPLPQRENVPYTRSARCGFVLTPCRPLRSSAQPPGRCSTLWRPVHIADDQLPVLFRESVEALLEGFEIIAWPAWIPSHRSRQLFDQYVAKVQPGSPLAFATIEHLVVCNFTGPRREVRAQLVLVGMMPNEQIGLLQDVFGVGVVGNKSTDVAGQLLLDAKQQRHNLVVTLGGRCSPDAPSGRPFGFLVAI